MSEADPILEAIHQRFDVLRRSMLDYHEAVMTLVSLLEESPEEDPPEGGLPAPLTKAA